MVGRWQLSMRWVALAIGAAIWLSLMILETGMAGVTALWTNAYFLALVVAIATATRTTSLYDICWTALIGGFLMAVMIVLARGFLIIEPNRDASIRDLVVPLTEELLKIAPVLFLIWLGRRRRSWSLGATDILLFGVAAGVGFAVVEDAFIRATAGNWPQQTPFLPIVETISGRTIAGHAIWTGLAAATVGLGLLLRRRPVVAVVVGASGFVWSVLDHTTNNMHAQGLLNDIGGLTVPLFLIVAGGCIAFDAWIRLRTLPSIDELRSPPVAGGLDALARAWEFERLKRALAVAVYHYRTSRPAARADAEAEAQRIMDQLGYPPDAVPVAAETGMSREALGGQATT